MDGILHFAAQAEEQATRAGLSVEVVAVLESYPPDCQQGARLMYQRFNLIPPSKPKSNKGGDYADWINGIREIAKLCAEYKTSMQIAFDEVYKVWNASPFTFDRPGGLIKTMRAALARVNLRGGQNDVPLSLPPQENFIPNPMPRPAGLRPRMATAR
jgi:hypothetical protein